MNRRQTVEGRISFGEREKSAAIGPRVVLTTADLIL